MGLMLLLVRKPSRICCINNIKMLFWSTSYLKIYFCFMKNCLVHFMATKQALKEKSKAHFHGNSLLGRLGTISVVEGGVGVGEELVLGVLVEHQHLVC